MGVPKRIHRLDEPNKYPPILPSSDEDSEYTNSRLAIWIGRAIVVVLAAIVLVGLTGLLWLMINGIISLGEMQNGQ
jgi:hypothetical protein